MEYIVKERNLLNSTNKKIFETIPLELNNRMLNTQTRLFKKLPNQITPINHKNISSTPINNSLYKSIFSSLKINKNNNLNYKGNKKNKLENKENYLVNNQYKMNKDNLSNRTGNIKINEIILSNKTKLNNKLKNLVNNRLIDISSTESNIINKDIISLTTNNKKEENSLNINEKMKKYNSKNYNNNDNINKNFNRKETNLYDNNMKNLKDQFILNNYIDDDYKLLEDKNKFYSNGMININEENAISNDLSTYNYYNTNIKNKENSNSMKYKLSNSKIKKILNLKLNGNKIKISNLSLLSKKNENNKHIINKVSFNSLNNDIKNYSNRVINKMRRKINTRYSEEKPNIYSLSKVKNQNMEDKSNEYNAYLTLSENHPHFQDLKIKEFIKNSNSIGFNEGNLINNFYNNLEKGRIIKELKKELIIKML